MAAEGAGGGAAMVTLGLRRVEESVAAKHPALPQYAACQSHAFAKGLGAFVAGSGAAFALHRLLLGRRRGALRWGLLLAAAAGSAASYAVTRAETQKCADFWVFLETGRALRERGLREGTPRPPENLPSPEDGEPAAPPRRNQYGDVVE